jgi:hypothetical protein
MTRSNSCTGAAYRGSLLKSQLQEFTALLRCFARHHAMGRMIRSTTQKRGVAPASSRDFHDDPSRIAA